MHGSFVNAHHKSARKARQSHERVRFLHEKSTHTCSILRSTPVHRHALRSLACKPAARYATAAGKDLEALERELADESGWKLLHGDVGRPPSRDAKRAPTQLPRCLVFKAAGLHRKCYH
eukprot:1156674-Pelagomonas_calceolata.AAC.14